MKINGRVERRADDVSSIRVKACVLDVIYPNCAGIDISKSEHWVVLPADVEFQINLKRIIQIKSERNNSMNHIVPTIFSDSKPGQRGWQRCASAA